MKNIKTGCQVQREVKKEDEGDDLPHVENYPSLGRNGIYEKLRVCVCRAKNLRYLCDSEETQISKEFHMVVRHGVDMIISLAG